MNQQINFMVKMCKDNPTESIGKSKEVLESCCKTIIERNGETVPNSINFNKLVKKTLELLNISNDELETNKTEREILKKITGSLNGLIAGINELRNFYGSGHGHSSTFKGLSERHAELCVGASIALTRYLWDTYSTSVERSEMER
ncbi:abortive infection family protein [Atopobacter sp. AH10]|uniref:abortive infection family protein n=1 Tax=Atopobacter sp. AH10 TaxID=2315861 RepID=UPI001F459245|nr:abortive infection family protein [Atopobacter sp. AH10]